MTATYREQGMTSSAIFEDPELQDLRRIPTIRTILDVVCRISGMNFSAVAHVTENRWVACEVEDRAGFGLKAGGELPIETTLCAEVRSARQEIVIDDATCDSRYCGHPTPAMYGLRSYISVPILLEDGSFFGTLCAIDAEPRTLIDSPVPAMFRLFARMIARHIEEQRAFRESRAQLADSIETAALREQFIAVLGHDLRNPLASLIAGTRILMRSDPDDQTREVLDMMRQSADRMSQLVNDMLDLARGRLAGGISIRPEDDGTLQAALHQVVAEIRTAHPARTFEESLTLTQPVRSDHARLCQLLSNLLGNAVAYGDPTRPIVIRARTEGGMFELSVANGGCPIPAEALPLLFKPFFRREAARSSGLGLGLYIAAQIAQAHDGTLTVRSDEAETCFTFQMPL